MKTSSILVLLLVFITLFCSSCNEKYETDVKTQLAGKWISLGFYVDDKPDYDTLGWEFTDEFDGSISEMTTIIWTDSGKYRHVYSTENKSLLRIEKVKELTVNEFEFLSDTTGILYNYDINPAKDDFSKQKRYANTEKFQLIDNDSIQLIRFTWPNDTTVESRIKLISSDSLILQFRDNGTSRFKKLNMP